MTNYIQYLDVKSMSLADVVFEVGDTDLSIRLHTMVLERLKKYQGDRIAPIFLGGNLVETIKKAKTMRCNRRPVLKVEYWQLSKSSYIRGLQCPKYFYLDKHKKREASKPSVETQILFKEGHNFEKKYRTTIFPSGINVKNKLGDNFVYFNSYTRHLLSKSSEITLFEGTIIEDGVLIMVDVINKINDSTYDFYEIKLYSELNDVIWDDLAIQYYVSKKRFGDKINTFNVILRRNLKDWKVKDLKNELEKRIIGIEDKVEEFKNILQQKTEPKIKTDNHCKKPYDCAFIEYCGKEIIDKK